MKVLMINSVCGIRSTGRICTDIAEVLIREGHECRILYGRESVPEKYQKYSVRIGNETGVKINALKSRVFDNEGFNAKQATIAAIEYIKNYKPDLIHLHNLHGYYINIKLLFEYLAKAGIPVVCTMHDCWMATGHCAYFTMVKCSRWKTGCHHCMQKRFYPSSYCMDRSKRNWMQKRVLFENVDMTLVPPSQWLADILSESFLGDKDIQVIHNGIDIATFRLTESLVRQELRIGNGKMILGVASAWGESKGLLDFIQLASMIRPQDKIVLVGLTKEQKNSLPESIIGITRTNNVQELAALYSAADVFVNPTHQDNYPTVNLEARACGTPVITYDAGGSPESAGEDAIVVKIGDVVGLKDAIERISGFKNSVSREKISREHMVRQYIDLYTRKIKGGVL